MPRNVERWIPQRSADSALNLDSVAIGSSAGPNRPGGAFAGGYIGGVTPVPIPNTAVKTAKPMILLQRESRLLPAFLHPNPRCLIPRRGGSFLRSSGMFLTLQTYLCRIYRAGEGVLRRTSLGPFRIDKEFPMFPMRIRSLTAVSDRKSTRLNSSHRH